MKFQIIFVGKTEDEFISVGIERYLSKLNHYVKSEIISVNRGGLKSAIALEEKKILNKLNSSDYVVLLDEKGKLLSSVQLSSHIQKWMNQSFKRIVFITGGAFGVSEDIKKRANFIWSVSPLTFTHQMIRVILTEQLYRAMTILNGESYHHK